MENDNYISLENFIINGKTLIIDYEYTFGVGAIHGDTREIEIDLQILGCGWKPYSAYRYKNGARWIFGIKDTKSIVSLLNKLQNER